MTKKAFGTYEIADICHVSPSTVGNWVEKGLLPTFTTGGGHRRVWTKDLIEFLKMHNVPIPDQLKSLSTLCILIVDDEESIRSIVRRSLLKLDPTAEVLEAEDGFEAGQKISSSVPALVILDLKLPGIDGLKVCKMIRSDERLKNTKILAISGHNPAESEKQSIQAGANAFLAKPFDAEQLKEKAGQLLALKH